MDRPLLQQRTSQQTTLTPRLQQSVHLLQLSSTDFAQELEDAIASNPFLDMPASERMRIELGEPAPSAGAVVGGEANDAAPTTEPARPERDAHDGPSSALIYDSGGARDDDHEVGAWAQAEIGLKDHLTGELGAYRLEPRDRAIARLVIEALDDDGYLRQCLDDVRDQLDFDPPIDDVELDTALHLVQQLGPAGIAARDTSECLVLQLQARQRDPFDRTDPGVLAHAIAIARDHLKVLARRDWAALARLTRSSLDDARSAGAAIKTLNPRPGTAFGGPAAPAIVPDVLVRRTRQGWIAETNPNVVPRTRLNTRYAELFHRSRLDDRQPLAQQLQEARWLLRNVAQRFVTIQRVAQAIIDEQRAFFDYGDIAIRPLALRQVADQLELHESTVSRATQGKFMSTPRGIFEFKHFFSRHLATDTGGTCSTTSIRAAIRELIDQEDPAQALSDVQLAERLTEQGLCVARRTVTKYRGAMKIPPAELRRAD